MRKSYEILSKSGYTISVRLMDHAILIRSQIEQERQAYSDPDFTRPEYGKGKAMTPLEWMEYSMVQNSQFEKNGISDHYELIFKIRIKRG